MIVVGLKGLIGSGKTTVARHLIEKHGFVRGRFAGALKDMLRAFLRYRGCDEATIERMIDGDLKEEPSDWLNGKTPRHAMEGLGKPWGRDWMSPDLWIATETDKLWIEQPERVLFEDCRHANEGVAIERMNGRVWEVWQPGLVPKDQPTERYQVEVSASAVIVNKLGRLDETMKQVDDLVARLVARATIGLPPMQTQPVRP
ncbi:hypothetical protein [Bradyrhizobium retamae]|uniref:Deoxynucleotide monophosphate kinase n=1 Tax=Bradyrhizobium retamae TaxID=1300035 RepID=A0A0R3MU39_9BRAD|nr:hypothetical protein [Bradyrhizobium retamae]KRR21695.1 deoxynucleotide monophosphate kinase [Bradyrhizobium retamae]